MNESLVTEPTNTPANCCTTIFRAAEVGHVDCFNDCFAEEVKRIEAKHGGAEEAAAAVLSQRIFGTTVLHEASSHARFEMVKELLNLGADPLAVDSMGMSCTMLVTTADGVGNEVKFKITDLLLTAGVSLAAVNHHGSTALSYAVMDLNLPLMEFLLKRGAPVNIGGSWKPLQLLTCVCPIHPARPLLAGALLLLRHGARVNESSPVGPPLFGSIRQRAHFCARVLVAHGADVDRQPLMYAIETEGTLTRPSIPVYESSSVGTLMAALLWNGSLP